MFKLWGLALIKKPQKFYVYFKAEKKIPQNVFGFLDICIKSTSVKLSL